MSGRCSIDSNVTIYDYFYHDFKTGDKTAAELWAFAMDKDNASILRLAAFDVAIERGIIISETNP